MCIFRTKRDSMGRRIRRVTNAESLRIAEIEDPGDCCGTCRFYDVSRGIRRPRCRKHPGIRIVYIGWCGQWEGKVDEDEA